MNTSFPAFIACSLHLVTLLQNLNTYACCHPMRWLVYGSGLNGSWAMAADTGNRDPGPSLVHSFPKW